MTKTLIEQNVVTCIINIIIYYYRGLDNVAGSISKDAGKEFFGDQQMAELDRIIACYSLLHAKKKTWVEDWNKEKNSFAKVIKDMENFLSEISQQSSLSYVVFRDYLSRALTAIINSMGQREEGSSEKLKDLRELVNRQIASHNVCQDILTKFASDSELLTDDQLFQNSFFEHEMHNAMYIRLIKCSSAGSNSNVDTRINKQLNVFANKISSSANAISSALSNNGLIAPTLAPSVSGEGEIYRPNSFRVSDATINVGIAAAMGHGKKPVPLKTADSMVVEHAELELNIARSKRREEYNKHKNEDVNRVRQEIEVDGDNDTIPLVPVAKEEREQSFLSKLFCCW